MKRFFNNLFYKAYKVFLIFAGFFFFVVYGLMIDLNIDKFIFADESIAAVKFTLGNFLSWPLAILLSYISVLILMYIINTIRTRAFERPDKILVLKHIGLSVLVVIATFIAMQFNTVLYTDGRINSNNLIDSLSPEYTTEDYEKVTFYGESVGTATTNRAPRIYFQFYMIFFADEDTYIEFYPEEFRDYKTLYKLNRTLGDKLEILPEEGFPSNIIANMSESDYSLYKMMYKGIMPSDDAYEATTENYYEDETEKELYAFDGFYDF